MIVGFTGTQSGMTDKQKKELKTLLLAVATELHHGDCIGADREAHDIFNNFERTVLHLTLISMMF